jgi:hydroxymethylpyrimidine pyrophosphatase-like HAD family hydrolase
MALPSNVTKLTGLVPALADLGVLPEQTIGVGDAENDQVFLRACGLSVAVANALPAVQEMADIVTKQPRGAGVSELIERWESGELEAIQVRARH